MSVSSSRSQFVICGRRSIQISRYNGEHSFPQVCTQFVTRPTTLTSYHVVSKRRRGWYSLIVRKKAVGRRECQHSLSSVVVSETVEAALTKQRDGACGSCRACWCFVVVIFCGCSAGCCCSSQAPRTCVIAVVFVRAGTRQFV